MSKNKIFFCHSFFFLSFFVISSFYLWAAAGPFKINGVPLRRVNQAYVIATCAKVDVSGVNAEKFDDKNFTKEKKKKNQKGESEFFEIGKEVYLHLSDAVDDWLLS